MTGTGHHQVMPKRPGALRLGQLVYGDVGGLKVSLPRPPTCVSTARFGPSPVPNGVPTPSAYPL